jgi:hypothetical protein
MTENDITEECTGGRVFKMQSQSISSKCDAFYQHIAVYDTTAANMFIRQDPT